MPKRTPKQTERIVKYLDIPQGSPEWLMARLGRMTASHAQAIATAGKGLDTLCLELAAERITGKPADKWQGNADTERGHELEDAARAQYEWTGATVKQIGFVEYGDYAGCSPDGLADDDGGIEIKSPNAVNYMEVVMDGFVDSKYRWQMQMNMLITGRKWWDYLAYNPNFTHSLHIIRIEADPEAHQKLLAGLELGESKIKEIIKKMEAVK